MSKNSAGSCPPRPSGSMHHWTCRKCNQSWRPYPELVPIRSNTASMNSCTCSSRGLSRMSSPPPNLMVMNRTPLVRRPLSVSSASKITSETRDSARYVPVITASSPDPLDDSEPMAAPFRQCTWYICAAVSDLATNVSEVSHVSAQRFQVVAWRPVPVATAENLYIEIEHGIFTVHHVGQHTVWTCPASTLASRRHLAGCKSLLGEKRSQAGHRRLHC
jgi:hypothetical protein